ncbi:MAG TPA: hypothetical protein VL738_23350 [Dactylosporangium sp.]|nr:hypothetical protein [Dactylosporangium sp.]
MLPLQPPKDGTTSPPPARIWLIAVASALPDSGRLPSHAGVQPPPESMNAIVNHRMPVADWTVCGFGGSPQPMYRYGAAAPPDGGGVVPPVVVAVTLFDAADSPWALYALTV